MFEFVFLSGSLVIIFFKSHYLLVLLSLELVMISIFFGLCLISFTFESFIFLFIILVLEGAFGLSILINNSRRLGGDFFSKANISFISLFKTPNCGFGENWKIILRKFSFSELKVQCLKAFKIKGTCFKWS